MALVKAARRKKSTASQGLYIQRGPALRRLGLSLADFRKLCILKGIFPRVPKKLRRGDDKVYYHVRDIQYLAHDPLINKFKEDKAVAKKIRKALAKKEPEKAKAIFSRIKKLSLTHIIRERYPTLVHALRDLDDALSTVALFAVLPAARTASITGEVVAECRTLINQWMLFTSETRCVNKVFASIKGFYYQATILGERIVWVMPHEFTTKPAEEVDLKVMATFLELYRTLLKFVLFKLHQMTGYEYPPTMRKDGYGIEGVWMNLQLKRAESVDVETLVDEASGITFLSQAPEDVARRKLFEKQIFYVSRETAVKQIVYCLKACGAKVVGFDESLTAADEPLSPIKSEDSSITHHVVDRPVAALSRLGEAVINSMRSFIQPQWVLDSLNFNKLLPTSPYAPGTVPPAHLSPFVDDKAEGYVPDEKVLISEWAGKDTSELQRIEEEAEKDEEEEHRRIVSLTKKKRKIAENIKATESKKKEKVEKLKSRKLGKKGQSTSD
eukprot:Blabericola_migrator_1__2043@NODE_1558_length_4277_cov_131_042993_g1021_i0_p2_GENE_NODE_1558_length_4277_cov_131_042993_g1021_i0NODE_1558_length_4277_cov_131_042993_g1021_i0_p2_ORF_typecomplete_len498_score121_30Pescadillo_N/PF06732_11/5_7e93Pescadillo_N/PF06732_11/1_6e04BRCT_2/PF16589_5/3_6e10Pannexin_like/PF12534_8/0_0048Pannexin_like/PF12534_8/1_2e03rRNA_processing/PF08524_11/1_1e02rRNA_processing/PF08524_11/0_0082Astro_capsid_p/PF12226_8/0_064RXLR/PF16810_5/38RXLR/PF16810_5/45_NODE_1558_leng